MLHSKLMIVGAVASTIIIGLLMAALWWSQEKLGDANKQIGNLKGQVMGLNAQKEYVEKIANINKDVIGKYETAIEKVDVRIQGLENGFKEYSTKAFGISQKQPTQFGDDVHVTLARWMCRVQAGTNRDALETCANSPAEAFIGDQSLTVTVTQDTAAQWRDACENYRYHFADKTEAERREVDPELLKVIKTNADLCMWSTTGFTPEGFYGILMPYLLKIEEKLYEHQKWEDSVEEFVLKSGEVKVQ